MFYLSMLLLLLSRVSPVGRGATPETPAHQAPLSLGFSRQEHWSELPFPSPMHESEKWKVKVKSLSRVRLFATPWTAAHQAPPSMGFSRQEYWSGVPLPSTSISIHFWSIGKYWYVNVKQGGFLGDSVVKNHLQCRRLRRPRFNPWVGKIPWRRAWQPTPVFLSGESHEQRSPTELGYRVGHGWSELASTRTLCLKQIIAFWWHWWHVNFFPSKKITFFLFSADCSVVLISGKSYCEHLL